MTRESKKLVTDMGELGMTQQEGSEGGNPRTNKGRVRVWHPDTEWYKKRRDQVPLVDRPEQLKNPFEKLLKSNGTN